MAATTIPSKRVLSGDVRQIKTELDAMFAAVVVDDTTGAVTFPNTVGLTGNMTVGGTLGVTGLLTATGGLVLPSSTITAEGPSDDVDVTGKNILWTDATSNNITIGGFVGGVAGQVLKIVRTGTANDVVLEHNEAGGNQDIFLADEADQTLSTYGGWTLVCDGASWYEVGY